MTPVGYRSHKELTQDTPYLGLRGKLWSVFYKYFLDKSLCYKGVNCISFSCQKLQVNDTQTAYLNMIWQEDGWRETTSDATPQIDDTDTQPAG